MTARRKTFGSATPDKPRVPVEVEINGEVFEVRTDVPSGVLLDFMEQAGDEENPATAARALKSFFHLVLNADDVERWDTFLSDPDKGPDVKLLAEVAGWLFAEMSGGDAFPTKPLPPSSAR